jgi:hypothetical protein
MVLLNITVWWNELITVEKIYWAITILSSIFFAIQLVSTFLGADAEIDMDAEISTDAEVDTDTGMGFQFFTLKNLLGFFTLFGWTGLGCLDMGMSLFTTFVISTGSGLVMMAIMATIFYFMSRLTDSGTLNIKNALGKTGKVYLVIPSERSSTGKVNIEVQGRNIELDALTDDTQEIPTGAIITVVEIVNNNLLLVKRQ